MQELDQRYIYDIKAWRKVIKLSEVRNRNPSEHSGPVLPLLLERNRKKYLKQFSEPPPSVPADIFVLAKGEPPDRDVTKIGGLPYRPRGKPWPEGMNFFCQFRLKESKDITGDLPGDILLVFRHPDYVDQYAFEWYDLGITDLIRGEEIPPMSPDDEFFIGWGIKHRVLDFPHRENSPIEFVDIVLAPLKIGGIPDIPGVDSETVKISFSVQPFHPYTGMPYPWTNCSSPILLGEAADTENILRIGYSVGLSIWLDFDDTLHFHEFSEAVPESEIDWGE